ncbi:trypsin-like peptidase domain-containing protein [Sporosarcina aquimarina]|uniref:Trypsin-like peptidase domain-containing protein n=1 Tax=Sporosarcina aquimarina TaxID=114975 RepID=A0ABU4FW16_9BACL|nr:trypsin-like peptidase domain-containing protein [Sporosarcina aquimarina]MDW0108851.1 trypsin-like peptidase domain-containing protein [Sporosarcina aquimarina]
MYCQHCGTQNEEDAKFCANCGKPVKVKKRIGWMMPVAVSSLIVLLLSVAGIGYFVEWDYGRLLHLSDKEPVKPIETAAGEKEQPIQPVVIPPSQPKQQKVSSEKLTKEKTEVIKESLPRVFTIFTGESQGSGFLYKKGGYVVTNAHVVAGYTDVVLRNSDGKDFAGKVIGISDRYDVALIQSDAFSQLQPLAMESAETSIGTEVIAIGSPQGFENSASIGYLTGLNRDMEMNFVYEKIYQIDAQIDQGSSGGPLLDAKTGRVIGINSLLYKENNFFGFSIPMHSVIGLVDQWAASPMSSNAVASLFGVYENYAGYDYEGDIAYDDEYSDFYEGEEESYEQDEYEDDYDYEFDHEGDAYPVDGQFNEQSLTAFMTMFRQEYEASLQAGESVFIMDYLKPDAPIAAEFQKFIQEVAADGRHYEFYSDTISRIAIYEGQALVTMDLSYSITDVQSEQNFIEKSKTYTVIIDEGIYYQISNVVDN